MLIIVSVIAAHVLSAVILFFLAKSHKKPNPLNWLIVTLFVGPVNLAVYCVTVIIDKGSDEFAAKYFSKA